MIPKKFITATCTVLVLGSLAGAAMDFAFATNVSNSEIEFLRIAEPIQEDTGFIEDPEKPEFERDIRNATEISETLLSARKSANYLVEIFQPDSGPETYKRLNEELFPEANKLTAVAFGMLGLARSSLLFNDPIYRDTLTRVADDHSSKPFYYPNLGYGLNSEDIFFHTPEFELFYNVSEAETNFWMILALLETFFVTGDVAYLNQANKTLTAINSLTNGFNSTIYNSTYQGYFNRIIVNATGQVDGPEDPFMPTWNFRDQVLALYILRKMTYLSGPLIVNSFDTSMQKIENLLKSAFKANTSSFGETSYGLFHSRAWAVMGGNQTVDEFSEILSLDHVLLYGYLVGKGTQLGLGSANELALAGKRHDNSRYLNGVSYPAIPAIAHGYFSDAEFLRQDIQDFLWLDSVGLLADRLHIDFEAVQLEEVAVSATNFLYATFLSEYAKILSDKSLFEDIAGALPKQMLLNRAYQVSASMADQGILSFENPLYEGVIDEGGARSEGWAVLPSKIAANAWAASSLPNLGPIIFSINYFWGVEVNMNQTIRVAAITNPSDTFALSPSILGESNFSLEGIQITADFKLGEQKLTPTFFDTWSLESIHHNASFSARKEEPGQELVNIKAQHIGFEILSIDVPYEVIGHLALNIQAPADGWKITNGKDLLGNEIATENIRIQIIVKDADGSDISNGHLEIWYQKGVEEDDKWFMQEFASFSSPRVITFANTDDLKVGDHDIIFFVEKEGYLPEEYVVNLEVVEPEIIERIRPILEHELTWLAGQILIFLGLVWKFNTIVVRRLRGKVTTCSQCGSITSASFPRCSSCGHLWTEEGVQDMRGRLRDVLGDVAGEIGLPDTTKKGE